MEIPVQTPAQTPGERLPEWLRGRRQEILRIAADLGANNVRVFGSTVRGEARPDSDLDLLVTLEPGRSLLDLVELTDSLGAVLGRKVDVVTDDGLYWLLRRRILREAVPL
jgi:predicted nucleotidyltransferase